MTTVAFVAMVFVRSGDVTFPVVLDYANRVQVEFILGLRR